MEHERENLKTKSESQKQNYQKPMVWYAIMPDHETTSLLQGASTFGEACEMLYQFRAQGFDDAYILLTMRI